MNNNPALWGLCALLSITACKAPASFIPEEATAVFDLRTGKELTLRQAAQADGFYGTFQ